MDVFIFWVFIVAIIVFAAKKYSDLLEFVREKHPEELENFQGFGTGIWHYLIFGSNDHVKVKMKQLVVSTFLFFCAGAFIILLVNTFMHGLKN
jgi:hypothetical protein